MCNDIFLILKATMLTVYFSLMIWGFSTHWYGAGLAGVVFMVAISAALPFAWKIIEAIQSDKRKEEGQKKTLQFLISLPGMESFVSSHEKELRKLGIKKHDNQHERN